MTKFLHEIGLPAFDQLLLSVRQTGRRLKDMRDISKRRNFLPEKRSSANNIQVLGVKQLMKIHPSVSTGSTMERW